MKLRTLSLLILAGAIGQPAIPCSRIGTPHPEYLVVNSDVIVHAKALDYSVPPSEETQPEWFNGELATKVTFKPIEVLKGTLDESVLELSGILSAKDDYNDVPVPYSFVRPGGRSGNCWAYNYKRDAEYLLFLRERDGIYTVNWYALGAVNEQLHGPDDPWLYWVKGFLAAGHFLTSPPTD